MSEPITWRQMVAPDGAAALRSMAFAGNAITNAFSGGADLASKFGKLQDEQAQQRYLSLLDTARTPEEIEALRQSGQLVQMQEGMTPQALAAIRPALDAKTKSLQQGIMDSFKLTEAKNNAADTELARQYLPVKDQAGSLIAQGNIDAATALLQQYPNMPGKAALFASMRDIKRQDNLDKRTEDTANANLEGVRLINDGRKIEVDDATRKAKEEQAMRDADAYIMRAQADLFKQKNLIVGQQSEVAKKLGIPVDSDGLPRFSVYEDPKIRAAKRKEFDDYITKNNIPSVDGLNTNFTSDFLERMRNSGKFTSSQMEAIKNRAVGVFDTSGLGKVGEDANKVIRGDKAAQAAYDNFTQNYSMPVTDAEKDGMLEEAINIVNKELPSGYNEIRRRQLIGQIAKIYGPDGGLKIKDPKNPDTVPTTIYPSKANLKAIIQENVGWGAFDYGGNDITDAFDAWAKRQDTNTIGQAIKDFQGYNLRKATRAVEDKTEKPEEKKKK